MSYPKQGMHFEDVRKRVRRIAEKGKDSQLKVNLMNSLLNQSRLCDGEGAVTELTREIDCNNHSSNRLGYSRQYGNNFDLIFGGNNVV
jgi:hypothetical protein